MNEFERQAREAERNHDWWKAYHSWLKVGTQDAQCHANACLTIAKSNDLGDRFRAKTKHLSDQLYERRINLREYMVALGKAHKEVYGV